MRYNKHKNLFVGAVLTLSASVALVGVPGAVAARDLKVGNKMPAFSLTDINGKPVRLASFKNKAVWLTFFHST